MADNDYYSDGDDDDNNPDAAAMAEAMGFTGFGMQRGAANKKRKLPTPPSQTGANNAPLGKRRLPMNLPKPVVSSSGGDNDDGGGGDNNPEEIDLDGGDDGGPEVYGGTAGEVDVDRDEGDLVNERAAALTVNDGPFTSRPDQQQQQHHSLPPRPQQQQQSHHAAQTPSNRGPGKSPWWEGTWDPRLISRMIENPWDRLEKQRGLEARGEWPSATARGGGGGGPAVAPRDNDNEGGDVSSSDAAAAAWGPPGVVPTIGEAVLAGLRQTN